VKAACANLPVVLRPYGGELLYSWLERITALYRIPQCELFKFSVSLWDLCVAPSTTVLPLLVEMTRLSSDAVQQLTISASGIAQSWWNIRQVTPDAFSPNMEYQYQPAVKFCRLCLWHDSISQGNEFLRTEWMLCVPTICPIHAVPMEDDCDHCHSQRFPIFMKTRRGFRLVCTDCSRPLAGPEFPHKATLIPELRILQAFELALSGALNNRWSFHFPGAAAGPRLFLQTVEDLLWLLLTRPGEDFENLFVYWLNHTVIRVPRRLFRNPGARPWLGDFPIQIRRGLVSHLAALIGGKTFRQQLIPDFLSRYALDQALTVLRPADAKEFKRRSASWPQMLKTLVFEPQSTH
jgi:hypothetical protein